MNISKKNNKLVAYGVVACLFIGTCLAFAGIVNKRYFTAKVDNGTKYIKVDWEKEYPFLDKVDKEIHSTSNVVTSTSFAKARRIKDRYFGLVNSVANLLGNHSKDIIAYDSIESLGIKSKKFLNLDTRFSKGSVQELASGHLISLEKDKVIDDKILKNYSDFSEYLKYKKIPFVYVQSLVNYDSTNEYKSESQKNRDKLVSVLKSENIDVLDLRQGMLSKGTSVNDMFYKTDHHWRTEVGLSAARLINQYLSIKYKLDIDKQQNLQDNLFTKKKYSNAMFGSWGVYAGRNWASPEDQDIYIPNYATKFSINIPDMNMRKMGSFEEVLINNERLKYCMDNGGSYAYETVLYGNRPLTKIINHGNPNGLKILVLRDSFALAVIPYLALTSSRVDSIDVRKGNGNFTGSVRTYIEQMQPDVVLCLYGWPVDKPIL